MDTFQQLLASTDQDFLDKKTQPLMGNEQERAARRAVAQNPNKKTQPPIGNEQERAARRAVAQNPHTHNMHMSPDAMKGALGQHFKNKAMHHSAMADACRQMSKNNPDSIKHAEIHQQLADSYHNFLKGGKS